jgi:hypothetical protein
MPNKTYRGPDKRRLGKGKGSVSKRGSTEVPVAWLITRPSIQRQGLLEQIWIQGTPASCDTGEKMWIAAKLQTCHVGQRHG